MMALTKILIKVTEKKIYKFNIQIIYIFVFCKKPVCREF